MKVKYDNSLKFGVISPSAWVESPVRRWFPQSVIFATQSLGLYGHSLGIDDRLQKRMTSMKINQLANDKDFRNYLESEYFDMPILLNKASDTILPNIITQNTKASLAFENKADFRRMMPSLKFANYCIILLDEVYDTDLKILTEKVHATEGIVIQVANSSGGLGTFVIRDEDDYRVCLEVLRARSGSVELVVSQRLVGLQEVTLQACIAKEKVFVGPMQEQLVRHELLVDSNPSSLQFCGGRVLNDFDRGVYNQAVEATKKIGQTMITFGYKGIYGVDFGLANGILYVIEVNARKTGLTPLVSSFDTIPPFYLLHCLELLGEEYSIDVNTATDSIRLKEEGSFIQVYAQKDGIAHMQSGIYTYEGVRISDGFKDAKLLPDSGNVCFVAARCVPGDTYKRGKSLAFIYSIDNLFEGDVLSARVSHLIEMVRD